MHDPGYIVFFMAVFILCGSVHEFAHAWSAKRLGDSTAESLGRLTLNPIVHVDPIGTLAFPLIMLTTGAPIPLMWMKPVPVNPWRFRNPRRDFMLVSLAGPLSNLLLAVLCALAYHALYTGQGWLTRGHFGLVIGFNLLMAVFNMVPIHPLDGSKILAGLLPRDLAREYDKLAPYGMIVLIACIYLQVFNYAYDYVVYPLLHLLMRG